MINSRCSRCASSSAPAGYRFPREVIAVAVRCYLRCGLSYRDVQELLAERAITVDHVRIHRWVQTVTPEFTDAARPTRHPAGDRWVLDETYVTIAGRRSYLYRAVDRHRQVIDVLLSARRDGAAARAFFTSARTQARAPVEVSTDRAPACPHVIDEFAPAARHVLERYANNVIDADHGRLQARLRPMRRLTRFASARTIARGTPSSRTCAEATANSPPMFLHMIGPASPLPNWPAASDAPVHGHLSDSTSAPASQRNSALRNR